MHIINEWLQWRGRLNRKKFIWRNVKFLLFLIIFVLPLQTFLALQLGIIEKIHQIAAATGQETVSLNQLPLDSSLLIFYLFPALFSLIILPTTIRRAHDIGMPTILALGIFAVSSLSSLLFHGKTQPPFSTINTVVTVAQIIFFITLLVMKGEKHPNAYGPNPLAPAEETGEENQTNA